MLHCSGLRCTHTVTPALTHTHTHTHARTRTQTHGHAHARTRTRTRTRTHTPRGTHTRARAHADTHTHTHTHTRTHTQHTHTRTHARTHARTHTRAHVRARALPGLGRETEVAEQSAMADGLLRSNHPIRAAEDATDARHGAARRESSRRPAALDAVSARRRRRCASPHRHRHSAALTTARDRAAAGDLVLAARGCGVRATGGQGTCDAPSGTANVRGTVAYAAASAPCTVPCAEMRSCARTVPSRIGADARVRALLCADVAAHRRCVRMRYGCA
jgi:hypothetical protein